MPLWIVRKLSEDEWNAYREPFATVKAREPIYGLRSELGNEATTGPIQNQYSAWLQDAPMPTLGLYFTPGLIGNNRQRGWAKENIRNLTIVDGGEGLHYVQEDEPEFIGKAIRDWMDKSQFTLKN